MAAISALQKESTLHSLADAVAVRSEALFVRLAYAPVLLTVIYTLLCLVPEQVGHTPADAFVDPFVQRAPAQPIMPPHKARPIAPTELPLLLPGYEDVPAVSVPGSRFDGHPSYEERSLLTWLNGVRLAPRRYVQVLMMPHWAVTDAHAAQHHLASVLGPAFPDVGPLQWDHRLAFLARAQARNHARLLSGELVDFLELEHQVAAIGPETASAALDKLVCQSDGLKCLADADADDTRRTVMMAAHTRVGAALLRVRPDGTHGSAEMGQKMRSDVFAKHEDKDEASVHVWVAVFGGAEEPLSSNDEPPPVPALHSGTHVIGAEGQITFWVSYTDPNGESPQRGKCYIFGMGFTIRISVGHARGGLYSVDLTPREGDLRARADGCVAYYFAFTDSAGAEHRYPQDGFLLTSGYNACKSEFAEEMHDSS